MPSTMSSEHLVSVIVPTYNYGHLIDQTLESLQAQTYQAWECVIVDDGSTDNTSEVVARYLEKDSRIKFYQQKNQRQAAARNIGIRNSNGKYFQFLDADDLIETKKLERQVEYLEQHPDVDIVYGSVRYFNTGNIHERLYSMWEGNRPWMPETSGQGDSVLLALVKHNIMVINSPLVRKRVVDTVGLFDEHLPPAEDWDYWIRCAAAGKRFEYQDFEDTLALVRSHPPSSSRDGRRMFISTLIIRKKFRDLVSDADTLRLNDEKITEETGLLGVEEVSHGNLIKGAYQIYKAGIMDRRMKHKLRWFTCALIAPFVTKEKFKVIFSSSITNSLAGALRASKKARS